MSPEERTSKLIALYGLRTRVDREVKAIEEAMAREGLAVSQARMAGENMHREREARCGTDSGYYRHLRRVKEPACQACLVAHRVAERQRRERRAAS